MTETSAQCVRVLVVDDDHDARESLRWLLEDAGYAVDEASDGLTALDLLRASPRVWWFSSTT